MDRKPGTKGGKSWVQRNALARIRARGDDTAHLWKMVADQRERLARSENYPVLHGLEESWEVLDEFYEGTIKRADVQRLADTPFEALMFHIEMGFYPPPELLLALAECYSLYHHSAGSLSFEEVLFGKPRRKSGGHAQRRMQRAKLIHMAVRMHYLQKEGYTKIRAAEIIAEEIGGRPEPESIVRMLNAANLNWIIKGL